MHQRTRAGLPAPAGAGATLSRSDATPSHRQIIAIIRTRCRRRPTFNVPVGAPIPRILHQVVAVTPYPADRPRSHPRHPTAAQGIRARRVYRLVALTTGAVSLPLAGRCRGRPICDLGGAPPPQAPRRCPGHHEEADDRPVHRSLRPDARPDQRELLGEGAPAPAGGGAGAEARRCGRTLARH